ncbi:FAD-dependent oxidoreductase [Thalassotalea sp. M1531]|uniref:FAD-dependent oxidoreductase n=1 Tax=Thalassotalea algicola TaxID=2716224 RepID=A0A7Y0Q5P3_9GAMM|nr:FAD-dependent oxidoreductase [Thalassotalea algicola]NMP31204.1 FAD-dependent oxidoreductase [Thalassotalea algicola]
MQQSDIIVVGGGMVGAASALSLAQLGLKVTVLERNEPKAFSMEQPFDLRVSAISTASENLLRDLGAWQQIMDWRLCPYRRLGVWESELAYAEFDADSIRLPHLGHIVENRLIQLALWQQIKHHDNVEIVLGQEISNFNQDGEGVTLTTSSKTFSAKVILAADGANSMIRTLAGIGCTGWNYSQSAMLINVETQRPQQDITWQQFFPSGPVAMLPMPGNSASLVWYNSREKIKQLAQMNSDELTDEIHKTFPKRLGGVKVIDKAYFPLTRQHANQYQKGRVLLLGDAAHTINPLAGQGVNIGFKDVKMLSTIIASAIGEGKCWHDFSILAQYEKTRRPDNLLMMSAMDGLYATFSNNSALLKVVRNIGLFAAHRAPLVKSKVLKYACGL